MQKQHFRQAHVPVGDFLEVSNTQQAEHAGREFGYPLMLKSRRFAYDGKGNAVVQSPLGLENAVQQLGGYKHGLYAEKWAVFVKVCLFSHSCIRLSVCLSITWLTSVSVCLEIRLPMASFATYTQAAANSSHSFVEITSASGDEACCRCSDDSSLAVTITGVWQHGTVKAYT